MTLKEKFQQWFINDEDEHYEGTVEEVAIEHEKVAEEFAIGFAEWIDEIKTLDNGVYYLNSYEELLEIYKKEKGL
jgi:hypothetical protein